ncbi:MAG: RNA polymerase factor sigma-54 [Sedimentisphaerales bacterium]|nr:RNA polymerase factor sigma-54 [Sedimentisphaerales bacterium]
MALVSTNPSHLPYNTLETEDGNKGQPVAMKMQMTGQMRMEQRMKLAPRMIQSMEVLQLPLLALQEKIEAELNSNPVLELADDNAEAEAPLEADTAERVDQAELVVREDSNNVDDFERLDSLGEDFADYIESTASIRPLRSSGDPDKKMEALQNTAAGQQSLHEYLSEQWRLVEAEGPVKAAGQKIIDYIDDKGYLSVRLEQLCIPEKNDFALEHLQQALRLVQSLEPTGVGARDVRECLLIQMAQYAEDMAFEMQIVLHCWDDLLENRLPQIARKMNGSLDQVNYAISRMSKLDTSPGLQVGRQDNHPITADVIVEPNEEGAGYAVSLADTHVPNLRVNKFYSRMARDREVDDKTRDFLQQNIRSAQWFMDAIEQRKHTLLRVAQVVVDRQKEFFEKGQLYLKPLPMGAVAEAVGVHIATVSRAVAGKYVQCPQGVLPLRSFFTGGTEDQNGESKSWDAIRARLQQIVDAEDKANPLNDDQLRDKLAEAGMGNIARRTVAKYRKLMNIPTARFRKKY